MTHQSFHQKLQSHIGGVVNVLPNGTWAKATRHENVIGLLLNAGFDRQIGSTWVELFIDGKSYSMYISPDEIELIDPFSPLQ